MTTPEYGVSIKANLHGAPTKAETLEYTGPCSNVVLCYGTDNEIINLGPAARTQAVIRI